VGNKTFLSADRPTNGRFMACTGGWDWVRKAPFCTIFIPKTTHLSRQARDKHKETLKKERCVFSAPQGPYSNTYQNEDHTFSFGIWKNVYLLPVAAESAVCIRYENRLFMLHSEMIILPRQARDKHRNI